MLVLGLLFLTVWCQASRLPQTSCVDCEEPNCHIANLEHVNDSFTLNGTACITDCISGKCLISPEQCARCVPSLKKALTYYTTRQNQNNPRCLSNCGFFGRNATWCYVDNNKQWDYCSLRNHETHSEFESVPKSVERLPSSKNKQDNEDLEAKRRVTRALADRPRETVPDYAARIKRQRSTIGETLNNQTNPIKKYYYRVDGNTYLPLIVEAEIEPHHIRPASTRTHKAVSPEAKTNCKRMGLNRGLPNHNNDEIGHLVSWKNGGPPDWYNFAPQTQRINKGTRNVTVTDVNSPSIWTRSEEEITDWVSAGKKVKLTVVVLYKTGVKRPIGFGTSETCYNLDGTVNRGETVPSYWYSNDPYEDPDEWN